MALNPQLSDTAANAAVNALTALLNNGTMVIYTSPQAANANTGLGAQTPLVTLTFGATAFGAASGGSASANAITSGTAVATGTPAWARCYESGGSTVVMDVPVGPTGNVAITAASNANPVVLTANGHGLSTNNYITISGATSGWAPINGTWPITFLSSNTFSIPVDSTSFGALSGSPVFAQWNVVLLPTSIVALATVACSSFVFKLPEGYSF